MAYLFFAGKMLSQDADSQLAGILFQNAGVNAAVYNGSLVELGDLADDQTYVATGDYEYDVYKATAPSAVDVEVAIVDLPLVDGGMIGGNYYKLGANLFNLSAPAGEVARIRRVFKHDKFWLGASNFASTPTIGQFAIATKDSCLHTPSAALVPGQYNIKILKSQNLTTGMQSEGLMYLVEVVELA